MGTDNDNGIEKAQVIRTGPEDWNDGSTATFEPWSDGYAVGFKCTVNGQVRYVYLNPSSSGDSPDVFVYEGPAGHPGEDDALIFVGFSDVEPFDPPGEE